MAGRRFPERASWAVERLAVRPTDHLLEIGCGRGSMVTLVCERLGSGSIVALDRSASMIKIARQRNATYVTTGRAIFWTVALEAAELGNRRFDKIFASNVSLFWVREEVVELAKVARALQPDGTLLLCYESPAAARARAIATRVVPFLVEHGFTVTTATAVTRRGTSLLGLTARPGKRCAPLR